jgi:hypothetical protein
LYNPTFVLLTQQFQFYLRNNFTDQEAEAQPQSGLHMFINAEEWDDGTPVSCDLCIVGAGAAGITLARHLASADLQVCLLESGHFEFSQSTQSLCGGKVTGRKYFDLDMARLRFFGGSTNHWSGWCCPLDPIDF